MKYFFLILAFVTASLSAYTQSSLFTLDTTFHIGQGFDGDVNSIAIQSDGKIIIGGNFVNFNGIYSPKIARLNLDGSLDNTFISPFTPHVVNQTDLTNIFQIEIQTNGQILVAGQELFFLDSSTLGFPAYSNFTRLNPTGSIDMLFSNNVFQNFYGAVGVPVGPAHSFALQNDGSIYFPVYFGLIKYLSNGTSASTNCLSPYIFLNTTHSSNIAGVSQLMQTSTSDIVCFGIFDSVRSSTTMTIPQHNICSFNTNLCPNTFNHSVDSTVNTSLDMGNGYYFIGGNFNTYDHNQANKCCKISSAGNLDNTFILSSNLSCDKVLCSETYLNSKLLLGIKNGYYSGTPLNQISVFNNDGSYDNIASSIYSDGDINAIKYYPADHYLYCAGNFLSINGQPSPRLARFNSYQLSGLEAFYSPNPSLKIHNEIGISTFDFINLKVDNVDIYDSEGKVVFYNHSCQELKSISVPLSQGLYVIKVSNNIGKVLTKSFLQL